MNFNFKYTTILIVAFVIPPSYGFWDFGTTTPGVERIDTSTRVSFFRWQQIDFVWFSFWYTIDWKELDNRARTAPVAGISIDLLPLSTATIMNTRILITSANYLDRYMHREKDLRVWALGRAGRSDTPYRYRVFRALRVIPKSMNPEHQHGTTGAHVPRHDVCVIITLDKMYIWSKKINYYTYAYRNKLTAPHQTLDEELLMAGSGYQYLTHIYENYKVLYALANRTQIVDCSKYLPKYWGKFICLKNTFTFPGIQNGSPLFSGDYLVGLGCFEIRYNEDRIIVFTDLRYYVHLINKYADIYPGQYYEYAYPHWFIRTGLIADDNYNTPSNPTKYKSYDLFPLG